MCHFSRSGVRFILLCTYLFLLEGLHQLRHPTESDGEGQTGAAVAVGHLNALIAKIALPVRVATYVILTEDVRYEVSYVRSREGKRVRAQVSLASVT